jgi:hypothetical protein
LEYPRIPGALTTGGHKLARSTIAAVLRRDGIEPAPERTQKTTWKVLLERHWRLIVTADFFTVEVWTAKGLKRFVVLVFIDLSTPKIEIAGIVSGAKWLWMSLEPGREVHGLCHINGEPNASIGRRRRFAKSCAF